MAIEIPFLVSGRGSPAGALPAGASGATVAIPDNDGLALVQVHNPTGADATVTLLPQVTVGGVTAAGIVITVPAGETCWLGPVPPAIFNDDTGSAYLTDSTGGSLVFTGLRF